ncbi:MAG: metal ABC transporter ATP-binding protein [Pseudomonadota bacterium]
MDAAPLIALAAAGYRSGDRWLVEGVDLTVAPGEIVTLIGPNGSGKSTTARMALGLLKPSSGMAKQRSGLVVGYVPQKLTIDWTVPLSVERFMHLTGRLDADALDKALEATGALALKKAQVGHLSGGEFQRVMLARAIARKPDLLVLDEPVQGVDLAGEIALYDLIQRLREEMGCGVLLISHDLHVVMAATDRVICLNGHVCCSGTPGAVVSTPAYQSLFGSRAQETLAVYQHHHDHTHLPDGSIAHGEHDHAGHDHNGDPKAARLNESSTPRV